MSAEEERGMGIFEKFSIQIIPANGTKNEINAQQQIEFEIQTQRESEENVGLVFFFCLLKAKQQWAKMV